MKEIDFNEWMVEKGFMYGELKEILKMLYPHQEYLPNLESFIYWFYDKYAVFCIYSVKDRELSRVFNEAVGNKLEEYDELEKKVYMRVVLTHVRILAERGFKTKTLKKQYTMPKIIPMSNFIVNTNTFFELQYMRLNKQLPLIIKEDKNQLFDNGLDWCIEIDADYKETSSKEAETEEKPIIPIKLNLNKSQIAYLFMQLVDSGYLKKHQNPNIWKLVGQYFVDMNNKSMKDISQVMTNVTSRNKEGRPQYEADNIEEIVGNLKKFKD